MLGVDLSLAPVAGFVQERTGGNPFFVGELTRALVEDGALSGTPDRRGQAELTGALGT